MSVSRVEALKANWAECVRSLEAQEQDRIRFRTQSLTVAALATAVAGFAPSTKLDLSVTTALATATYLVVVITAIWLSTSARGWDTLLSSYPDFDVSERPSTDRDEHEWALEELLRSGYAAWDNNDRILGAVGRAQLVMHVALVLSTVLWTVASLTTDDSAAIEVERLASGAARSSPWL